MRPASGRLARARRLGTARRSTVVGGGAAVEAFEVAVAAPRTEARGNLAAGRSIHGPGRILAAGSATRRQRTRTATVIARLQYQGSGGVPQTTYFDPSPPKIQRASERQSKLSTRDITAAQQEQSYSPPSRSATATVPTH